MSHLSQMLSPTASTLYPPGDANAGGPIAGLAAQAPPAWARRRAIIATMPASATRGNHSVVSAHPVFTQGVPEVEIELPILTTRCAPACTVPRAPTWPARGSAYLPRAGDWHDRVTHLEVLKYKPNRRCVVAYDLQPSSIGLEPDAVGQRLVGKVFRDDRGARHLALHQALWADGFGEPAADGITVARPLAYIPEMRMFVQERAPGSKLDDSLDAPDFGDRVRRCAATIAKLHASRVRPAARYTLADKLASLEVRAAELAAWRPDRAEAFSVHVARLRAWAATLPQADLVPAHRDFYYSQVLFAKGRVTLIDLDLFALADPAIDVAIRRPLAPPRHPAPSDPDALNTAVAQFVDEYARQAALPAGFFWRAWPYEAAAYFRSMHVSMQRPRPGRCFDSLFELCEGDEFLGQAMR
jgi:hypothetical protein